MITPPPRHRQRSAQRLQHLNKEPDTTVTLRVDTGAPPLRLLRDGTRRQEAGPPALGTSVPCTPMHPADPAAHARSPWDELRVWDPGGD